MATAFSYSSSVLNHIRKVVPWFSIKDIGVVAPKYIAKNRKGLLPRLISLENSYNSTMFKMHTFFGSMISFRGCGIAIRRDVFEKLNGWAETLIEDSDFAVRVIHAGYKIHYEPEAIVETLEPTEFGEMKKQKLRWGRGSGFAIFNNREAYLDSFQALFHFLPYVGINLAIALSLLIDFILIQTMIEFLLSLLWTVFLIIVSVTIHNSIIMLPERERWSDVLYIPFYSLIYLPIVLLLYMGGIVIAIIDRIRHKPELDFKHW